MPDSGESFARLATRLKSVRGDKGSNRTPFDALRQIAAWCEGLGDQAGLR